MVKNPIIAFLEHEKARAEEELSKQLDAQGERNAERAFRKQRERSRKGAKARMWTKEPPDPVLPDRVPAYRAASRQFVAEYLLAKQDLLQLPDLNQIRLRVKGDRPELGTDLRTKKFDKCLDEYLEGLMARLAQSRSAPSLPVEAWSETDVRAVLKLRVDLAKRGLRSLESLQAGNDIAARICLEDQMNVHLAERFLHSNHLTSLEEFERVVHYYRTDVPLFHADRALEIAIWQKSVDNLISEVRQWLGTEGTGRDKN